MAFRDAVSRLLGRKNLEIRSVVTTAEIMGMSPSELYRTQPALRAVVSFLADNTAHLPLKCYIRQGDNDRPRDTKSTLALLMSNPSVAMTEHEILRATASDYYLYGYALWLLLPSNKTLSGWSITSIPVSWVESTFTLDGIEPSSYTVVNPETKKRVQLQAEDCIRFYAYDPDGPTAARSPVESLKQILSEQISAWNFRNGVWKNGGRVSAYLTRPANAPDWVSNGGRDRFARSWKAKFSGENGTDTGGTPLLEDGMELKAIQFNAREAEWTEATRLAREDVAAIYHINPLLVWPTSSSGAYSNAGDLARSLYVDTMGPFLNMVEERINHVLIPKLELDQSHYVEFDLDAKLQGDFKERAGVIQSSTGGPWLTRNEARAWMNLPAIPGGDELIVPLNVIEGGLASPNDTDPTRERYNSSEAQPIKASTEYAVLECDDVCPCMKSMSAGDADPKDEELRFKSSPSKKDEDALDAVLRQFYERQGKSVANRIQNTPTEDLGMHYQGEISWWQSDRWDKELAEDLSKYGVRQAIDAAKSSLSILGVDAGNLDESKIEEYARVICESRAHDINWNSLQRIFSRFEKLGDDLTPLAAAEAVREDFKRLADSRAERNARSIATAIANYGTVEGAKQSGYDCMKMWVVGSLNPRRTHSRMMGQRVKLDDRFSNGARWPGDPGLPPEETCNCCCRIEIIKTGEQERVYGVQYKDAMLVDEKYIKSSEYANKFIGITSNDEIDSKLLDSAIHTLTRNSGKNTESMSWIDIITGESVSVDCNISYGINYNDEVRAFIAERKGQSRIVAVHNHPNGTPPSLDDFSKAAENDYSVGVIAGHNGQVYVYKNSDKVFTEKECNNISDLIFFESVNLGRDIDRVCTEVYAEYGLSYEVR